MTHCIRREMTLWQGKWYFPFLKFFQFRNNFCVCQAFLFKNATLKNQLFPHWIHGDTLSHEFEGSERTVNLNLGWHSLKTQNEFFYINYFIFWWFSFNFIYLHDTCKVVSSIWPSSDFKTFDINPLCNFWFADSQIVSNCQSNLITSYSGENKGFLGTILKLIFEA